MKFLPALALSSAAVTVTAAVGSLATTPDDLWYKALKKPSFQPPALAFPIAWTALYASIAAASTQVLTAETPAPNTVQPAGAWQREQDELERKVRNYKVALGANLVMNAGWSAIFWQVRDYKLATAEAALLAASSIDLARRAYQIKPAAGALLLPYAGWTSFATVLSGTIAKLNP